MGIEQKYIKILVNLILVNMNSKIYQLRCIILGSRNFISSTSRRIRKLVTFGSLSKLDAVYIYK